MKYLLMLCVVLGLTISSGCGPSKGVTEAPPPAAEPENLEKTVQPGV